MRVRSLAISMLAAAMVVGVAGQVEPERVGELVLVEVAGDERDHDLVAGRDPLPAQLHVETTVQGPSVIRQGVGVHA